MAKEKISNYEILKTLFNGNDPTWDKRISLESRELFEGTKVLLNSNSFAPIRNQILDELINRIALTKVHHMSFNNPLSMLKKGEFLYGDTIQEIATDVIEGNRFESGETDQFTIKKPTVKAAYHRVNREDYYQVTIEDPRMRRAFLDDNGLQQLINEIISMMGGSNEIDEYIYAKQLFNDYLTSTEVPLQSSQIITVPDLTSASSRDDINSFIATVKLLMRKMVFPTRKYNSAGLMTQTKPDEMMCFLKVDYSVINEVNNLSAAFKPEYLDLNVPIVGLDDFGEDSDIVGVILDKEAMQIYNNLMTVTTSENAKSLYRNYFYHIHQTYLGSPFKNAIFLKRG